MWFILVLLEEFPRGGLDRFSLGWREYLAVDSSVLTLVLSSEGRSNLS
jgi:hypothetical protein